MGTLESEGDLGWVNRSPTKMGRQVVERTEQWLQWKAKHKRKLGVLSAKWKSSAEEAIEVRKEECCAGVKDQQENKMNEGQNTTLQEQEQE